MPRTHARAAASSASSQTGSADLAPLASALTPLELHAVQIVGKQAAKLRDRLEPENGQAVDITVRVQGEIHVAPGQTSTKEEHPAAGSLLAFVLGELPPKARAHIAELARAAYIVWLTGGDEPELASEAAAAGEDFLRRVSRQANKHVRGNVTGAIACKLLSRRP